ncbi:putative defensin-like protein 165 [Impatiens glandulifera]|uniref:putative defensin-like protein 165 n=1 Tax=Impatiens glandulifera TaxID=253017 RepID=UPI001FB0C432|nr:putative defensin-like protein 165 [Impatiens glandulifera]
MARLILSHVLIIVLALAAITMVVQVSAQKRCDQVLAKTGCTLATCREQCFKARNGNGVCIGSTGSSYSCHCIYNC